MQHKRAATDPLWSPSTSRRDGANLTAYVRWLARTRNLHFGDYETLWQWSVEDLEGFWGSIWSFFSVSQSRPHSRVLGKASMPGAEWFPGAQLNYVDQMLRHAHGNGTAILFQSESLGSGSLAWDELSGQVGALAATLQRMGVRRGDRVAAYLPNIPHTVVAFLATASLGAIWSVCAPDMGLASVTERFRQITPKILITCDGYRYGGKPFDRRPLNESLVAALPSLQGVIRVPLLDPDARVDTHSGNSPLISWDKAISHPAPLRTEPVPFNHPLWIVYSSGTTGLPKGIVHGHGGALAIGLTMAGLHWDLKPGDRFFWHASTGWIMWNLQVMGLLTGSSICLFDGAVTGTDKPGDWMTLWRFVADNDIHFFGSGAAFFAACLKAGIHPARTQKLDHLQTVGSTGSPLSPECYRWIYDSVKSDVCLLSTSGGTDIAGSFLTGSTTLPVYVGEMQCRNLGAAVYAFDDHGHSVFDAVGELVCTKPMPSMPLYFWGDERDQRYRESYFESFSNADGQPIWRHGDWLKLTSRPEAIGGVIYGRSDATINRNGIRMGTAELYRVVEAHPDVSDSLVIDLEYLGRPPYMGLFVVLQPGHTLTPELSEELMGRIRLELSPRHVPNEIRQVAAVPRTLTGKKLEVPLKKLLLGQSIDSVVNPEAVANPESLAWFVAFAAQRGDA